MPSTRRDFVRGSALGLLGVAIASRAPAVAPGAAAGAAAEKGLTRAEKAALAALGEAMLPGARRAGIAEFVGGQLLLPAERQVLMIKYLVPPDPPYLDFYRAGLRSIEAASRARNGRGVAGLRPAQAVELVKALGAGTLGADGGVGAAWSGPPQPLFHFIVRNDALDVVYGTKEGFTALGTPYMAHIEPPFAWPR